MRPAGIHAALLLCAVAAATAPAPSRAWGPEGHQTVGAIADRLLAGKAAGWIAGQILGGMTLRNAALWADCAKGVSSADGKDFVYSVALRNGGRAYPECAQFENPLEEARQIDFAARNWRRCNTPTDTSPCHFQYHYTDVSILRDH